MSSEYRYVRTNTKGKRIYRRDTKESLAFVQEFLKERGIPWEERLGAHLLYLYNSEGDMYTYYWTTGRWCKGPAISHKHYSSMGIEDFVSRFFNNPKEETDERTDV